MILDLVLERPRPFSTSSAAEPLNHLCSVIHRLICRFILLKGVNQLWYDDFQIAYDTQIGNVENRRCIILVDRNDALGVLHACNMLDGSGNSTGQVEIWPYGLSCLSHLAVFGNPARVYIGPR